MAGVGRRVQVVCGGGAGSRGIQAPCGAGMGSVDTGRGRQLGVGASGCWEKSHSSRVLCYLEILLLVTTDPDLGGKNP